MSRKAAKTPAAGRGVQDISLARRAQLDAGAPASNLTECLAVDFAALMAVAVPQAGADAAAAMRAASAQGISRRMALAGALMLERLGPASTRCAGTRPTRCAVGPASWRARCRAWTWKRGCA